MAYDPNKVSGLKIEGDTIASSAQASTGKSLGGATLSGVFLPATLTGTALTILGSIDGVNYYTVRDSAGDTRGITHNGSGLYTLNPSDFAGIPFVKVQSDATEAAERSISYLAVKASNRD